MKKALFALAIACLANSAQAAIAGGSHDLTVLGGGLSACQYCHAPHLAVAANVAGGPLWNRNVPTAGFTTYTSTTLMDTTVVPGINTQTCLSCHDGVTNMSTVVNGVDPTPVGVIPVRFAYGLDLSNDHPVGVAYPTAALADYRGVAATGLPLYAGQVECGSCHDPHALSNGLVGGLAFLRTQTVGTDLCNGCHIK